MPINALDPAGFDREYREKLQSAADRLEEIRRRVERMSGQTARQIEGELDRLRGLLNRARARMEGLRLVGPDALAFEQDTVRGAVAELLSGLVKVAGHLPKAA